jgi:hypothetical protein
MDVIGAKSEGILVATGAYNDGRPYGISRFGNLPKPMAFGEFLPKVKKALNSKGLRYYDAGLSSIENRMLRRRRGG